MTPAERQLIPWLRAEGPASADVPDSGARWRELADAAANMGLAGLLLERARRIGVALPPDAQQKLRMASMAVAANNLHLINELTPLLEALQRAGIPVLLLKGAALIHTIYPDLKLRPMSDLDLLVPPAMVAKTLEILAAQGCRSGQALLRDDFFPKYYYELELQTGSLRPARIDLHARPFRPLRYARTIPDDAFWENPRTVRINEVGASILRPELMFIHLAVHAAVHGCSRLLWLYDLRRLIDHHGHSLDWTLVTERAGQWRLSLPLSRAVEQTAQLLGPLVPEDVVQELNGHRTNLSDRLALNHAPRDAGNPVGHVLVNLLTAPGVAFRIGYLMSLLFPGPRHLAHIYAYRHRGWRFMAHVWRCLRAVGRLGVMLRDLAKHGARCAMGRNTQCHALTSLRGASDR